jgi:hypothetical protein
MPAKSYTDDNGTEAKFIRTRVSNERLVKQVVFGMVDGTGIRGRQSREWLKDVKDWCQMDMHKASNLAQSRSEWRKFVEHVVDTNGH